jgi:hypothetical protein
MATKRIEERGWICMEQWSWDREPHYVFRPGDKPAPQHDDVCTRAPVLEHTLIFDMPADFDPRPEMVEALETKKRELTAEFQANLTELDRRISKLQAIEYSAA